AQLAPYTMSGSAHPRALRSFPTRRSSDLVTVTPSGLVTVNGASSATLTMVAGGYYIQPTIGTPSAAGTYTISAGATGFTSATSSTATVTQPNLHINIWSGNVGAGLSNANSYISL